MHLAIHVYIYIYIYFYPNKDFIINNSSLNADQESIVTHRIAWSLATRSKIFAKH